MQFGLILFLILIFDNHIAVIIRNIKDIARLRGSEDLWEVAKLHDRESSFPEVFINLYSDPSNAKLIIKFPISFYHCIAGPLRYTIFGTYELTRLVSNEHKETGIPRGNTGFTI